jgi:hypothetical protein
MRALKERRLSKEYIQFDDARTKFTLHIVFILSYTLPFKGGCHSHILFIPMGFLNVTTFVGKPGHAYFGSILLLLLIPAIT